MALSGSAPDQTRRFWVKEHPEQQRTGLKQPLPSMYEGVWASTAKAEPPSRNAPEPAEKVLGPRTIPLLLTAWSLNRGVGKRNHAMGEYAKGRTTPSQEALRILAERFLGKNILARPTQPQ